MHGDYVHLAPGARLGGAVKVGEGAFVGIGAAVREGIEIGSWSFAGMGAAVVGSIPPKTMVYGNPAQEIRRVD